MNQFYDKVKAITQEINKFELEWIDNGNHSLKVGKRNILTQKEVDFNVISIINKFIQSS